MDIPDLDELQFLEANSHLYDEEDDDVYLDLPPPAPHQEPQSPPSTAQKRPRSNDDTPSDDKRGKIECVGPETEIDEDWLRYSPPPQQRQSDLVVVEEELEVVEQDDKFVRRYASEIDGDFIPVTAPCGSGDRVYAKICRVDCEATTKKLDIEAQSKNGLILDPINVLLERVEQKAFTKALQTSTEDQYNVILPETPVFHKKLWVDKYAPNSFTELLSDEQTNREVLLWLKQWDSCVFGSEIRSTSDDVLSALKRHSSVSHHQKVCDSYFPRKNGGHQWSNRNFRHSYNSDHQNSNLKGDQDSSNKKSRPSGPPEQKILLLCGPPGLGKTTLAHVAAKHCGYHVLEVNASDDRSSSTIEAKILDAVQMNSVMGDSKPKCLVIDEIDGTLGDGKGAVDVIIKMVSADKESNIGKENASKEEQSGKKSNKRGRKTSLSRPVICICNDLYAPVLRPLRKVAKVHIFIQPTVSRVVSRLKYICNQEDMKTSSIALTTLAEYTECDIRSCLNTLQFLNKKMEALNVLEISSQVVGRKDMSKSVFDIWKEIFQKRKMKRDRKSNNSCSSTSSEFDFLHSLVSNRGDYDLILDGIHENILQLNYHDPVMQKTVKCLNSLGNSDLMHQYIMRTQQMPIYVYLPFAAIIVHHQVAQVQRPNLEWPKSYQRYRTTMIEKMDVLRSWHNKILPYISRHLSTKSFVEDSISHLLHILSPATLRPVAMHLLSEKEKNDLAQLISTMVSYSVTYKNMKSDRLSSNLGHEAAIDASALSFDPPIGDFINFKGYNSGHHVLALAMKQVLVHEVEKQKILQLTFGKSVQCNKENQKLVVEETTRTQTFRIDHPVSHTGRVENSKSTLDLRQCDASNSTNSSTLGTNGTPRTSVHTKNSGDAKKPFTDPSSFFDRFRKLSSRGSQNTNNAEQKGTTFERDLRPLLFKFNEGFTNAVKRPVRMREFLL
ncbi:AAA domain-containing protein [Cephalotus follicularis]|uniref:Chromosome transmission fidelity protein 18 homolog n=1 Tax=Cephalotus follicularis TaxID=3775 RepID=A0A1Q3BDP5_CEPFO|nr:AAA domain-containing protein [Cephalotus follicularis]